MVEGLDEHLAAHPHLLPEQKSGDGTRRFPLLLPDVPEGRSPGEVWLELPGEFPARAKAKIRVPISNVLKIPHVEVDGSLCLANGDPGPYSGASAADRVDQLIDTFYRAFLGHWCAGELDGDFAKEALNYWLIHCARNQGDYDAITTIYTLNEGMADARVYDAEYLTDKRVAVLADDLIAARRYIDVLGSQEQLRKIRVADIPISLPLTPISWPKNEISLKRLVRARLTERDANRFLEKPGRRGIPVHRIVVLRAPQCSFGFLLPGGPPTLERRGKSQRTHFTPKMLPIAVERLDPSWTYGRDQHSEVYSRQQQHVLVVGAGALGSPVIEQLAKAGIGKLTIIDSDDLSSANIGRHVLGANSIGKNKAICVANHVRSLWPSCITTAVTCSMQRWLQKNDFSDVDVVLDLTGEPDVRLNIEISRQAHSCRLLIGWMEPFVAAAHACALPEGQKWFLDDIDRLNSLMAVDWPDDVMQNEPACSSRFQSYTPSAAAHAVALVSEAAIDLIDNKIARPVVRHWVRGQSFLDANRPGLTLREWAARAAPYDGISMEMPYA